MSEDEDSRIAGFTAAITKICNDSRLSLLQAMRTIPWPDTRISGGDTLLDPLDVVLPAEAVRQLWQKLIDLVIESELELRQSTAESAHENHAG